MSLKITHSLTFLFARSLFRFRVWPIRLCMPCCRNGRHLSNEAKWSLPFTQVSFRFLFFSASVLVNLLWCIMVIFQAYYNHGCKIVTSSMIWSMCMIMYNMTPMILCGNMTIVVPMHVPLIIYGREHDPVAYKYIAKRMITGAPMHRWPSRTNR